MVPGSPWLPPCEIEKNPGRIVGGKEDSYISMVGVKGRGEG